MVCPRRDGLTQSSSNCGLQIFFMKFASVSRPLLFLMDGHSSHFQPEVVRKAVEHGVVLFCLPPHTTHTSQPLDKCCFKPLKTYWSEECERYMPKNHGEVVTRFQFSEIFNNAWCRAMSISNIHAGFRTTGVYPFNRKAIHIPGEPTSTPTRERPLPEHSSLSFIPLLSPHPSTSCKKSTLSVKADLSSDSSSVEQFFSDTLPCLDYDSHEEVATQTLGESENFSREEEDRFETRYENGYDLVSDKRYNAWLQQTDPSASAVCSSQNAHSSIASSLESGKLVSVLSSFLKLPIPPSKQPDVNPKYARVLTSLENLQWLEEKDRKKQEQAEKKELRKREREEKARLKAIQKAEMQKRREEREHKRAEKQKNSEC